MTTPPGHDHGTPLENDASKFGNSLYKERTAIERNFGDLTSTPDLLAALPGWVRTLRRVRMWVQTKLILADIRTHIKRKAGESAA